MTRAPSKATAAVSRAVSAAGFARVSWHLLQHAVFEAQPDLVERFAGLPLECDIQARQALPGGSLCDHDRERRFQFEPSGSRGVLWIQPQFYLWSGCTRHEHLSHAK